LVTNPETSGNRDSGQAASELPVPRAATGRHYLVFVRAGRDSWHRRLILEDPERNWDCCVSWYDAQAEDDLAEYYCATVDPTGSNKMQGFLEFWERRPQPWDYRYIILLDDDVYLRPGELSHFFRLCELLQSLSVTTGLALAHPYTVELAGSQSNMRAAQGCVRRGHGALLFERGPREAGAHLPMDPECLGH
jgi:hypothetical protein